MIMTPCSHPAFVQLIAYLTTEARPSTTMADADFVTLLWQGLMSNVETDDEEKTDVQIRDAVLAWVKVCSIHQAGTLV